MNQCVNSVRKKNIHDAIREVELRERERERGEGGRVFFFILLHFFVGCNSELFAMNSRQMKIK